MCIRDRYMEALIAEYFLFDENMTEEEQAKNGTAEDWIYRGYMSSLNDPYSVYYDKDEYTSLNEETSGTYCGIGVQVSQNVYTGIITAVKVFKNSPAQEAGMLPGDILYKVEDIEATGEDLSLLVSDHIRGEEGTKVHLTVYRLSLIHICVIPEGIEAQAEQVMKNMKNLLEAAGTSIDQVVKTSVFIKNMDDFATINGIYAKYFEKDCPARSCVEIARLPKDEMCIRDRP